MSGDCNIGLVGLAVMGQNLVLNLLDHDNKVAVYNRTTSVTDDFVKKSAHDQLVGTDSLQSFVDALAKPRKIILMVKAGNPVDAVIDELRPLLDDGDILIDGGNSLFTDSQRRSDALTPKGIHFVGCGISGGQDGARFGPSMMPGGDESAWPALKPILQGISAKTDAGEPCCEWMGDGGSGHFVKMVHNGIEYGDMQMIAEIYHLLGTTGLDNEAIAGKFDEWNQGRLSSYLVEITAEVLRIKDDDGSDWVDNIWDKAGQKGTGKWTAIQALELGVPGSVTTEAVYARALSSRWDERQQLHDFYQPKQTLTGYDGLVEDAEAALYAAKLIAYAQGFSLLSEAAREYNWTLNMANIAQVWKAGCIIRAKALDPIQKVFEQQPTLDNLMLSEFYRTELNGCESALRRLLSRAIEGGVPTPALSNALAYFDGVRSARLPANLIQGQRNFFGAHEYERLPR
ncbi:phosphogluconate dehydrogenase (NADP(+)-dependent, decarboxylating) [Saccharospirillum sp. MSK14-1]|uniref:decarboxylating NADP(+)-dependent phosphogluconate dehydrogenase n=1 Tax=Saccharospirillum sp. MSK14-1 TaxID=1897632 RepID=UPI000D392AA1|nr:decarboxylating NADP(+)-dependent phosphogluconate dehydrogenase [Saccharospirillum sp. MSK14-1]PTY35710.1 phosphogluconate dehydrogenase (NADP(+)-dependent, decarboxylating) [Saccharospirillum sp. MSK14-1]